MRAQTGLNADLTNPRASIVKFMRRLARRMGFDIVSAYAVDTVSGYPIDFDRDVIETIKRVRPYTMTSPERIFALCRAVEYIAENGIAGAIVECGVWRGGSIMAALHTLKRLGNERREIYLYDTFSEMPPPTKRDRFRGQACIEMAQNSKGMDTASTWGWQPATLADVRQNVFSISYPQHRIHFIKGRVEDTLSSQAPSTIALLRLDTDFYDSTRHELMHLYPRVSSGGVIIVDDYGHSEGVRLAVDEFIKAHKLKLLLNRIDYTGRIAVKP